MAEMPLSLDELRALSAYAAECAEEVLEIYEREHPTDTRPREAVDEAWTFARGGKRGKALRDKAFAGLKAAKEANTEAAREAARAAVGAAGSAYLHPLPNATQVKHILGSAASAARAVELTGGDGAARLDQARQRATPAVVEVLRRYPAAPPGGGRVGELIRELDDALRERG